MYQKSYIFSSGLQKDEIILNNFNKLFFCFTLGCLTLSRFVENICRSARSFSTKFRVRNSHFISSGTRKVSIKMTLGTFVKSRAFLFIKSMKVVSHIRIKIYIVCRFFKTFNTKNVSISIF